MKTIHTHGTFEQAIAEANDEIQAIAHSLRQLIAAIYPQATELPWPKQQIIGYGLGPKKMTEHFCYIGAHSAHVNLGFYYGANLPDPARLLQGTGKQMRHIKLSQPQQLQQPAVADLLEAAIQEREQTLGRPRA